MQEAAREEEEEEEEEEETWRSRRYNEEDFMGLGWRQIEITLFSSFCFLLSAFCFLLSALFFCSVLLLLLLGYLIFERKEGKRFAVVKFVLLIEQTNKSSQTFKASATARLKPKPFICNGSARLKPPTV